MGISKCNAEGYYDPTAYEGIRNVEADAKKLRIKYPTGHLELNLDQFFPCSLDKAKKVFSLIHKYSSEADQEKLLAFLRDLESRYFTQMLKYDNKASSSPAKSEEHRGYISRYKKARQIHQEIARNIELFTSGRNCK